MLTQSDVATSINTIIDNNAEFDTPALVRSVLQTINAATFQLAQCSNKASVLSINMAATVAAVQTLGYATPGDGGGAFYIRVISPTYPTYAIQSADGAWWQYVPGPEGWNAKVAGVVADGVTDDAPNLMNALLPFQNPNVIVGGGNVTGRLILPGAKMVLTRPVIYAGKLSSALSIRGQSNGAEGVGVSTSFTWKGTSTYTSMFILYGANSSLFDEINFDGQTFAGTSGITNDVHITADNSYLDHLTSGTPAGTAQTFNVTSNATLAVGVSLGIGAGTANFEIVYISSLPGGGTSFVATCVNSHNPGELVGSGLPTNNIMFRRCAFSVPPPFNSNNKGCGILVGNPITVTVQAAQVILRDCIFTGGAYSNTAATMSAASPAVVTDIAHGLTEGTAIQFQSTLPTGADRSLTYYVKSPTTDSYNISLTSGGASVNTAGSPLTVTRVAKSYAGVRAVTGGNIKNYFMYNCVFQHCQIGIAGEQLSGSVEILYPTFAGSYITDILANGCSNLHVVSAETESTGQAFLLGTGGANAQGATLEQCSFQSGLPNDLYVVNWAGNLTLINNTFFSQSQTGPTVGVAPRIKVSGVSSVVTTLLPGGVTSIGNYFQFGGPTVPVFYDGSNNPFDRGTGPVSAEWRVAQINDYGDSGRYDNVFGQLSSATTSLSSQNTSSGVVSNSSGLMGQSVQSYTIPFTAFQTGAAGLILTLFQIPPHTTITGVVVDVTTPFSGGAITSVTLKCGTNLTTTTSFILSFDAKTAAVTKGQANGDLGAQLASATRPAPLGYTPANWTTGSAENVTITMNADANLSNLTAGSVTVYVTFIKFR